MLDRRSAEHLEAHDPALRPGLDRYRVTIYRSSLVRVEDASLPPGWGIPPLCEADHQMILPYHGLFASSVGSRRSVLDANRTLFISPQQENVIEHPVRGTGDAALVMTPSPDVLDEICSASGSSIGMIFAESSRPATVRLRLMTQHLLRSMWRANDPLRFDEWVIRTLYEAFQLRSPSSGPAPKLVEQAKQLLHARFDERLSLNQMASQIGVTPAYLTQEFARREGTPLYRYQLQLRLNRALLDLPHCEDITRLALDLGFSSHSHFTMAFGKTFGMTPSEYRSNIGSPHFC